MIRPTPFLIDVAISTVALSYLGLFSPKGTVAAGLEESAQTPWPVAGNLTFLRIEFQGAPGGVAFWTITVRINGVSTAATLTIVGAATTGSWTGSLAIAEGDRVNLEFVPTGGPASGAVIHQTVEFDSSETTTSGYGNDSFPCNNILRLWGAFSGSTGTFVPGADREDVIAVAGTIEQTRAMVPSIPFAIQKSDFTFTLYLNGVVQDGTAGSVDTRCLVLGGVLGLQTFGVSNYVLPVVPGDRVWMQVDRTLVGFDPGGTGTCAIRFRATTPGQAQFCGQYAVPGASGVFNPILTAEDARAWGPDLATSRSIAGPTPFSFDHARLRLTVAPGVGQSRTVGFRLNGVNTALAVTLADLAVAGTITAPPIAVVDLDLTQVFSTQSAAPAASLIAIGLAQQVAVAAAWRARRCCPCRCRRS